MSIKAIIFDFGEVLNLPAEAETLASKRARVAKRLGLPAELLWSYLFEGEAARKWMTGKLSWSEFWHRVLGARGISDPEEVEAIARDTLSHTRQVNPEMAELLFHLKERYKLAVLSNASWTEAEMRELLFNDLGLPEDMFAAVVTSNSAGAVKPDPRIFKNALARLGVEPGEALFVDDLPNNTRAAAALGLQVHTFSDTSELRAYLAEKGLLEERVS